MLAPEERHGIERLAPPEDIERGGLALPLGDDPVFDADRSAAVRVRPARNIACCIDAWDARLEILIDDDPIIDCEPRVFGQPDVRAHADAGDDEIGGETFSRLQYHSVFFDRRR